MAVLANHQDLGVAAITWVRRGNLHSVTYGYSVKVTGCDMEACHEFGECVRHSLECAGKLDNTEDKTS